MKRRDFIKLSAIGAAALLMPSGGVRADDLMAVSNKTVVLIELEGGNDGLNTLVPFGVPAYYDARPTLAVEAVDVNKLDDEVGLHPRLPGLFDRWNEGSLAVVEGVGYPEPNLSHFRSKDIVNSASNSDEFISDGWVRTAFMDRFELPPFADSVTMAPDDTGPFNGTDMRNIVMESANSYIESARGVKMVNADDQANAALSHIINTQNVIVDSYEILADAIESPVEVPGEFPQSGLGQKLYYLTELLANGIVPPVFKVSLGSFDTHNNQKNAHENLLEELDSALSAFADSLKTLKLWNNVVVMTYSEFGRRVEENGSLGTDHGTASVQFILGGSVNGGFYGARPSLTALDHGNLIYTTDYRTMYRTVIEKWWSIETDYLAEYGTFDCL